MFHVYIIQSQSTGKYYVGSTSNIERRIKEHNNGSSHSTQTGWPWLLKRIEPFKTNKDARKREAFIKKKKSKKIIEKIISSPL